MHCQVRVIHLYFPIVVTCVPVSVTHVIPVLIWLSSVGITTDQRNSLQFLYERDPKFGAMPTFGILLAQKAIVQTGLLTGGLPAWRNLDFSRVYITWMNSGRDQAIRLKILTRCFMANNSSKSINPFRLEDSWWPPLNSKIFWTRNPALWWSLTVPNPIMLRFNIKILILENIPIFLVVVTDAKKKKILTAQWSVFLVGYGGFGGKSSSEHIIPTVEPPNRKPDVSVQYQTGKDQVITSYSITVRLSQINGPIVGHVSPAWWFKPFAHRSRFRRYGRVRPSNPARTHSLRHSLSIRTRRVCRQRSRLIQSNEGKAFLKFSFAYL